MREPLSNDDSVVEKVITERSADPAALRTTSEPVVAESTKPHRAP